MNNQWKKGDIIKNRWTGGGSETTHLKITYSVLADLFDVKVDTVRKWVYYDKIDPSNLLDIIEKFNNRHLLDRRRRHA